MSSGSKVEDTSLVQHCQSREWEAVTRSTLPPSLTFDIAVDALFITNEHPAPHYNCSPGGTLLYPERSYCVVEVSTKAVVDPNHTSARFEGYLRGEHGEGPANHL